jgi:SpoVK/Ycf46/Vps4 family AAA+-type ATPase
LTKKRDGHFVVSSIIDIDDFKEGTIIQESDLLIKNESKVVQFTYFKEEEDSNKFVVTPGIYNMVSTPHGVSLEKLELRSKKLLTTYDNTTKITAEADSFFNNLHKYDELGITEKKRAILLYSPPGYGKTSAISKVCEDLYIKDQKTVVINWPTSEIRSSEANRFLSKIDYETNNCSRLTLIIEDIGGGEQEDYHGRERGVDSSLLNLLDGVDDTFPIPTFIMATTNHPGSLLDALADRPGRFDEYIELDPPNDLQRVELIEFISNRKCTDSEVAAIKKAIDFSPAHLAEVVKRSFLKNQTYECVIDHLLNHKKKVSKRFEKNKASGMGLL